MAEEDDSYCAICSGPLYNDIRRGINNTMALKKRKKRLNGDKSPMPIDCICDGDVCQGCLPNDSDGYDSFDEEHSYNPQLVDVSTTEWLDDARAVGFNPNAPGISKAFITAHGTDGTYETFSVNGPATDPNDPEGEYYAYYSWSTNVIPVFPFHDACSLVLSRALFGREVGFPDEDELFKAGDKDPFKSDDENTVDTIDKDVLYSVMTQLATEYSTKLNVDYGGIDGNGQNWYCKSGEEYTVHPPTYNMEVLDNLQNIIADVDFSMPPSKLDLEHRVRNDSLSTLPHDILYMIFPHLSIKDIFTLMGCSWHVYTATRNNGFWKQIIRRGILPWFWELSDFFEANFSDNVDFKGLYLWLDRITKPRRGMEGDFMSIANRRRIWNVCEQVGLLYWKTNDEDTKMYLPRNETAEEIMWQSMSLQLPVALHPKPRPARMINARWVRSWDELYPPSASSFDSYWNRDGLLVGLAVTFEEEPRIFGIGECREFEVVKESVDIPSGEWITGIILHISNVDLDNDPQQIAATKALTILLTSGESLHVGTITPDLNHRALKVTNERHLTGLIGAIALIPKDGNRVFVNRNHVEFSHSTYNNVITRLGLLQACENPYQDDSDIEVPQIQRLLWHQQAALLPTAEGNKCPIWDHLDKEIIEYDLCDRTEEVPVDMFPHQALIWATSPAELAHIRRISAFAIETHKTYNLSGEAQPGYSLLGMRVEYEESYSEPPRSIGVGRLPRGYSDASSATTSSRRPNKQEVENEGEGEEWPEKYMVHFDIDGPGGEVVELISAAHNGREIKLQTNRGRECNFGEGGSGARTMRADHVGQEYVLAGIAMSFYDTKKWSVEREDGTKGEGWCMKPSSMTGLVVRENEEEAE